MKRCSTCNRTYTDPNLSFCIDDGTPLTPVEANDDATVVTPRGNENDWNAQAYRPPQSYVPPGGGEVKRRRAWPWVVGILGAFLLGIVVIGIAAAILAPRMMRRLEQDRAVNIRENSNRSQPSNSNTANANVNSSEDVNTPPPTDQAQVLAQLTDIENEWTVANLNADKQKLDRILADDFITHVDGQPQSKADYIRDIDRDTSVDKWEFKDLKLVLLGDRAVLSGTITYYFFQSEPRMFEFVDKFVWRDGRWQATGAVIGEKEGSGTTL